MWDKAGVMECDWQPGQPVTDDNAVAMFNEFARLYHQVKDGDHHPERVDRMVRLLAALRLAMRISKYHDDNPLTGSRDYFAMVDPHNPKLAHVCLA